MKIGTEFFALNCDKHATYNTVMSALLFVPYKSDFFYSYREQATFLPSRSIARYSKFNFGAGLSRNDGFSLKNALIRHKCISLQSVCAKTKLSWTVAVKRHSLQKLHSSTITLLRILTYFRW